MERSYHAELLTIRENLILMAEKAMSNTRRAVEALEKHDLTLADAVVDSDHEIDEMEVLIDHEAIKYMTLRSPVASDMRLIAVAIKASHELERIGDEASNIAKRAGRILRRQGEGSSVPSDLMAISSAAILATDMLQDAINAFVNENAEQCVSIIRSDKQVDSLNRSNFDGFAQMLSNDSGRTESILDLIFISKSIERVADHATNIAEDIIYLLSGKEVRHTGIKKGSTPIEF